MAWTQTVNLATDDPELAWKLMAATALDAYRLKASAGVRNTGRKSDKTVMHVTLRWAASEADELIPEEMMRASRQAIEALGAQGHQVMVVAHCDKDPHVHLVINRVSPTTGKMLSSSKEKLKLSGWAQRYEEDCGEVLCRQRVINNAARGRGTFTRGEKDIPRAAFEQIRANDNTIPRNEVKKIWLRHRGKDRAIGARQRKTRHAQAEAWARLQHGYRAKRASALEDLRTGIYRVQREVHEAYRPEWERRHSEREAAFTAFQRNEKRFLGRLRNRVNSIDLRAIVLGDAKGQAIRDAFTAMGSAGARLEKLKVEQDRRDRALERREKLEIRGRCRPVRRRARDQLAEAGTLFQAERASLLLAQAVEQAKMRAEWARRVAERRRDIRQNLEYGYTARRRNALNTIRRTAFNHRSRPERDADGRDRS